MSDEQLAELNEEQLEGLQKLTQQLLTSNISNQDYQAILLGYRADVEANQEKIVDEAEQHGNVDYWLSSDFKITMTEALADFRQEYLTFLGSNAKDLSPPALYDAIADIYKQQLKAMHFLARALEDSAERQKDQILLDVKTYFDRIATDTAGVNTKLRQAAEKLSQASIDVIASQV